MGLVTNGLFPQPFGILWNNGVFDDFYLFMIKQPRFPPHTATVADQATIGADNSMTWDDDGNGIFIVGASDLCACRLCL